MSANQMAHYNNTRNPNPSPSVNEDRPACLQVLDHFGAPNSRIPDTGLKLFEYAHRRIYGYSRVVAGDGQLRLWRMGSPLGVDLSGRRDVRLCWHIPRHRARQRSTEQSARHFIRNGPSDAPGVGALSGSMDGMEPPSHSSRDGSRTALPSGSHAARRNVMPGIAGLEKPDLHYFSTFHSACRRAECDFRMQTGSG